MADEAPNALVDCLVGWALDWLKQELNYVFNYQSFITTLRDGNEELGSLLPDVKGLVEDAELNGEEITDKLKDLLEEIKKKQAEAEKLLLENSKVKTCCWDFIGECNCPLRNTVAKTVASLSDEIIDLIKKIDGYNVEVSKKPKPPPLWPTLAVGYKNLDSREDYLKRLMDALLLEDSYRLIRVYGEKKVGKTMLVEKLAVEMELRGEFKHIVLMSGEGVGTKEGLFDLQQQIAERIGFELKLKNVEERKRIVNQRLTMIKKVLIIVDNVDETFDLNKIGIPDPVGNDACRIVVVSSSSKVCTRMKAQLNFEVKPLSTYELQELHLQDQNSDFPGENFDQKDQHSDLPLATAIVTNELLAVEPPELRFPMELKKEISCTIQLTNKTDQPVAFKVMASNWKEYAVKPNTGLVLPRSTLVVVVTMKAQKEFPPNLQSKDKFLVQSIIASSVSDRKDLTPEMFKKESGNLVEECMLRVAFVSP